MTSVRLWVVSCFRRLVVSSSRLFVGYCFLNLGIECLIRARRKPHFGPLVHGRTRFWG